MEDQPGNLLVNEKHEDSNFSRKINGYVKKYQQRFEVQATKIFYNRWFSQLDKLPKGLDLVLDKDLPPAHFVLASDTTDWAPSVNNVHGFKFMKV